MTFDVQITLNDNVTAILYGFALALPYIILAYVVMRDGYRFEGKNASNNYAITFIVAPVGLLMYSFMFANGSFFSYGWLPRSYAPILEFFQGVYVGWGLSPLLALPSYLAARRPHVQRRQSRIGLVYERCAAAHPNCCPRGARGLLVLVLVCYADRRSLCS